MSEPRWDPVFDVNQAVDHLVDELAAQGVEIEDADPDDWTARLHRGDGRLP